MRIRTWEFLHSSKYDDAGNRVESLLAELYIIPLWRHVVGQFLYWFDLHKPRFLDPDRRGPDAPEWRVDLECWLAYDFHHKDRELVETVDLAINHDVDALRGFKTWTRGTISKRAPETEEITSQRYVDLYTEPLWCYLAGRLLYATWKRLPRWFTRGGGWRSHLECWVVMHSSTTMRDGSVLVEHIRFPSNSEEKPPKFLKKES